MQRVLNFLVWKTEVISLWHGSLKTVSILLRMSHQSPWAHGDWNKKKKTSRVSETILALVLLGASRLSVATPLPDPGLLRVPRIYNALITTDAKLQPSRASPYSVPAVPVIGPPLGDFARVDDIQPHHHHAAGKKSHRNDQPKTDVDLADVPALGKDEKKLTPSSRMYPETFYPQSVGYYPHPFIPYSYPLAPQPYPFGQYSSAGVGGGPEVAAAGSYSAIGGPGFAAGSGLGVGLGPYGGIPFGAGVLPAEFGIEQSSSLHMTSGRRQGVESPAEDTEGGEGDGAEGDELDDEEEP